MKLHEFGEGGMVTSTLCSETVTLWRKGIDPGPCPDRLDFSISLPTQYSDEKDTYVRAPFPPRMESPGRLTRRSLSHQPSRHIYQAYQDSMQTWSIK